MKELILNQKLRETLKKTKDTKTALELLVARCEDRESISGQLKFEIRRYQPKDYLDNKVEETVKVSSPILLLRKSGLWVVKYGLPYLDQGGETMGPCIYINKADFYDSIKNEITGGN